MPTIRRLNIGEATIYRSIRLEALKDSPDAFATTYESASARDEASWIAQADSAAEGDDRAIFLLSADRPVGLAALYRDADDPSVGELVQMWIAPSHRGGPAAIDLLDHLFRWASARTFASVRAEVTPGNLRALRFYEKYGFHRIPSSGDTLLSKPVPAPYLT